MFPIVEMARVLHVCLDVLCLVCTDAQCRGVPYVHDWLPMNYVSQANEVREPRARLVSRLRDGVGATQAVAYLSGRRHAMNYSTMKYVLSPERDEQLERYVVTGAWYPVPSRALNPFRPAVPFGGKNSQIISYLSPRRDCGPRN